MSVMDPKGVHDLDRNRLKKYFISVGIGKIDDHLLLKQFKTGQSNPTYYVKFGGKEMVLRKKPPGKLLRGAHQINREFRVMKAVHSTGLPVPQMISYCLDTTVIGTEFFVMEFMPGKLLTSLISDIPVAERRKCLFNAVKTLAQLHQVEPETIGLSDFGKKFGFCNRVLKTWTKQYYASADKDVPEMHELIRWLETKISYVVDESSVIHGDYSYNNVLFNPQKSEVLAILDWELSTIGHPLMDLAYLCLPYHAPDEYYMLINENREEMQQLFTEHVSENELVKYYCELRGICFPIPNWNFYLALNLFKLAGIIQGVYARYLQGNASSPAAQFSGVMVLPMIQAALKLTRSEMSAATAPMLLSPSPKGQEILTKVKGFIKEHLATGEKDYIAYVSSLKDPYSVVPLMEEWKKKAKAQGLWNLFLPAVSGLSNVDYAHIAEQLGRSPVASEIFNCSAPDTGNMEVLHLYGSDYQKETWLKPLLNGEIRSAFCMTEPQVASSDATNMELTITRDGNSYIVNGRKWWSTGAANPRCKFGIVMGKTAGAGASKHQQHSMIIVPFDTPGVTQVRNLRVFGYDEPPGGHSEMLFDNVRVPARNLILGEGRGFEIAQGRLGPGRIHHCMRSIGLAERCMELMIKRGLQRKPFGKRIVEHQVVQHQIADCRIDIDQARLLTLHAASMIDQFGTKRARKEISMIKVAAPKMLCKVIDQAIQIHGGGGVSDDFPLAMWYSAARTLRLADGPDEVHLSSIGKMEIRNQVLKSRM